MSKLSEQMNDDMLVRGFAARTRESYLAQVRGLAKYYHRSPDQLSEEEVQGYLVYLLKERALAWSSCNQAASAFRFFYHHTLKRKAAEFVVPAARQPQRLPEVPSREEIARIIDQTANIRERVIFELAYGGGLRVGEIASLRVRDIDSEQKCIWIRGGKGGKDRTTLLSEQLLEELRRYWYSVRPGEWLFARRDGRGPIDTSSIQRMWTRAKRRAGVTKQCGIHSLRHAFATHLLESGTDLVTVQRLLGHGSVKTTMRYLHLARSHLLASTSPLDLLLATECETEL